MSVRVQRAGGQEQSVECLHASAADRDRPTAVDSGQIAISVGACALHHGFVGVQS